MIKLRIKNRELKSKNLGFTLIELLVTISIIGILSTLLLSNFNAARERARDAQRKSDLKNMQIALRLYYNDHGAYPTASTINIKGCNGLTTCTAVNAAACTWGEAWICGGQTYMSLLPKDPLDNGEVYMYRYVYTDGDNYTLSACLENKSDEKGVPTAVGEGWCPSGKKIEVKP